MKRQSQRDSGRNARPSAEADDPSSITLAAPRPALPLVQAPALPRTATRLLLLPFRSGEPVQQHPDLQGHLQQGWQVKSAVPRVVEAEGARLFVVLTRTTPKRTTRHTA